MLPTAFVSGRIFSRAFRKASKGVERRVVKGAATTKTAKKVEILAPRNINFSRHALERLTQRGITEKMVGMAISKGLKFYDPKNGSVNYVLKNSFGSGKGLLIGTNPLTGEVRTVLRGSNLVRSRMLPID